MGPAADLQLDTVQLLLSSTYAITAMIALYFNVFVLIAQTFEHVPAFHALAPTGTETPFKVAQTLLLVLFAVLITTAAKKFRTPLVSV